MPSTQRTTPRELDGQIDRLMDRADTSGLSPANEDHLEFLRRRREFLGKDVHLVIEPLGVIRRPGERHKPKIVCVYDTVAADKLSFARKRGERVRLATPAEIALYQERNKQQQTQLRGRVATQGAQVARASLEAMLGQTVANTGPETAQPIPEPEVEIGTGQDDDAGDPPAIPELTEAVGGDQPAPLVGTDVAALETKFTATLSEAGFDTVEKLAEASPVELKKLKGIGAKTAAELVVKASEHLAPTTDEGGDTPKE